MAIGSAVVLPVSLPRLSPPRHERLVRFFGLRLRLVAAIVVAAVVAGGIATAYLALLERASEELGPERFGDVAQIVVLVATGVLVAIGVHVLGHPADVELLVDNIHVPETGDANPARLRSLLPVSLACIAVGGTLGPEAPVVTTSGTLAHRGATAAGLTADDIRIVTLTGMAAGFAVLFGAPLGGAVFALEIPHRRGMQYHEALVPAAIGAAIGFVITGVAHGFGVHPVWTFVPGPDPTATDLGWSVLAGAVGAAIAVVFTVAVRTLLAIARRIPPAVRPAVGGLALGALAIASPFALTNGEFQLDQLVGDRTLRFLAIAAAVKLAAAAVAVATGWRGGFIIPLFVVGFAVGIAMAPHLPGATPWVFAVGVMAAANVGVTKTPIGSTLVVSEMTASMVLAPTLIASLTALVATSEIGLIHSQRERVDAYGERHGAPD